MFKMSPLTLFLKIYHLSWIEKSFKWSRTKKMTSPSPRKISISKPRLKNDKFNRESLASPCREDKVLLVSFFNRLSFSLPYDKKKKLISIYKNKHIQCILQYLPPPTVFFRVGAM